MNKELVKFIEARLADDEHIAEGAARNPPGHNTGSVWHPVALQSPYDTRTDEHLARHDPARVLREVQAKRLILAEWHQVVLENRRAYLVDPKPAVVVLALALSYADHPDYRAEWAP